MEIVKAVPVNSFNDNESIYHFKIELVEINKIMIEIFNSRTGIKYRTYLNNSDEWWEDNSSKFQNDFSKVYEIINNCISKTKEYLKYEIQEKNDILSLKIIYMNDLFPFDVIIKIQRIISENGLTDEKINVLEYQLSKLRDIILFENIIYSKQNSIPPDGDNIEINNEVNNIIFKGSFKNNKRNGFGTEYDPNTGEGIFKGNYKDGYRDGEGETYINYILRKKAEYKKGILHGKVINYQIFSGDLSNEVKISGESDYKDGLNHGKHIDYQFYAKTQKHFISVKTNYINGSQNGLNTNFTISATTGEYRKHNEYTMKDCLMHGEYITYGDGGVVSSKKNYNMGVVN